MAQHGFVNGWKAKGLNILKFYSVYQSLTSLGFIFLLAYTERWQEANWPEGRVVYIHPWILFLAWALLGFTLIMGVAGRWAPGLSERSDRLLPYTSWALLVVAVLMAMFMPGPYGP